MGTTEGEREGIIVYIVHFLSWKSIQLLMLDLKHISDEGQHDASKGDGGGEEVYHAYK